MAAADGLCLFCQGEHPPAVCETWRKALHLLRRSSARSSGHASTARYLSRLDAEGRLALLSPFPSGQAWALEIILSGPSLAAKSFLRPAAVAASPPPDPSVEAVEAIFQAKPLAAVASWLGRCIEGSPLDYWPRVWLAVTLLLLGRYRDALAQLEEALSYAGREGTLVANTYRLMGLVLMAQGQPDRAKQAASQGLCARRSPHLYYDRALFNAILGANDEAAADIRRAVTGCPSLYRLAQREPRFAHSAAIPDALEALDGKARAAAHRALGPLREGIAYGHRLRASQLIPEEFTPLEARVEELHYIAEHGAYEDCVRIPKEARAIMAEIVRVNEAAREAFEAYGRSVMERARDIAIGVGLGAATGAITVLILAAALGGGIGTAILLVFIFLLFVAAGALLGALSEWMRS